MLQREFLKYSKNLKKNRTFLTDDLNMNF